MTTSADNIRAVAKERPVKVSHTPPRGPGSGQPMLRPPKVEPVHPRSCRMRDFRRLSSESRCRIISKKISFCCSGSRRCTTMMGLGFSTGMFRPGHRKPPCPGKIMGKVVFTSEQSEVGGKGLQLKSTRGTIGRQRGV